MTENNMTPEMRSRIQRMYLQDCFMAWFDVALLVVAVGFVLFSILHYVDNTGMRLAMYVSSGAVVVFNTASVYAMTSHYSKDKDYIYGMDIKHLDDNRQRKAREKEQMRGGR